MRNPTSNQELDQTWDYWGPIMAQRAEKMYEGLKRNFSDFQAYRTSTIDEPLLTSDDIQPHQWYVLSLGPSHNYFTYWFVPPESGIKLRVDTRISNLISDVPSIIVFNDIPLGKSDIKNREGDWFPHMSDVSVLPPSSFISPPRPTWVLKQANSFGMMGKNIRGIGVYPLPIPNRKFINWTEDPFEEVKG